MARITQLHVNGVRRAIDADAGATLLSVLRDNLGLTGTKFGCGEGACRACTVLLAGKPVHSCLTPVGQAANKQVITIEGLAKNGRLHPVQQAFLDAEAFQCGYCTSGMIMTAVALLREHPDPSEKTIREFMEGNICRCGAHPRIIRAIQRAAAAMKQAGA
jgi:aerobic-type carbon monoxide dehydrogenase small subunit (CoxS/CutS family)